MYFAQDNCNNHVYNVGVYIRLSREDEDKFCTFSDSVKNQKEFLTRYLVENDFCIFDFYIDDGYTGTNFDRPDFQRMIRDIQCKRINTVVTKDLSRLGRDHIDTSYYVEKYFLVNNIRYIAVTDGIDTFLENNSNNDMSPFKSVINDMYARDTSKKVRTIFDSKRRNGEFIGAFAPYGYKKSSTNKNRLIIDQETAPIVKRIFDMYISGNGYTHIASVLNLEGVQSPTAYKIQSENYKNPKLRVALWSQDTIRLMLQNPTYAGNMTQRKYSSPSYKIKKMKTLPKSQWIIVEDTHEAIINKESFILVQEMLERGIVKGKKQNYTQHFLSGLIYCGDCGAKMTFSRDNGSFKTICSSYKRFRQMKVCTRHSFSESRLEEIVINELRKLSKKAINIELLEKATKDKSIIKKENGVTEDIRRKEARLLDISKTIRALYEDKIKGVLLEQDFISMSKEYNMERANITGRLDELRAKVSNSMKSLDNDSFLSTIKSFADFEYIDRTMLMKLIDKIEIFADNRIKIYYKFQYPSI